LTLSVRSQPDRRPISIETGCYGFDINGVLAADFKDSMTAKGIIGLQVHAVGKDRFKPYQVRWRNIRIQESD